MSALDFGARGIAMQARAAADRLPSLNTPALLALAQGQQRPVDLVCIGDSVQLFNGYGWDAALTRAFAEDASFGIWASPLWPVVSSGNAYTNQGYTMTVTSTGTGVSTGAPAEFDDCRLPDCSYLYTASGAVGNCGCLLSQDSVLDNSASLRFQVYHGTFNTGSGSFRLGARMEASPYTSLGIDGSVVSTSTGTIGEAETYIDLPAASRNHSIGFKLQRPGGTASVGPTIFLGQRVRNKDRTKG
ncbi:MAG: hypothetical protein EOP02_20170, partial [Proteobacteria bacterium]